MGNDPQLLMKKNWKFHFIQTPNNITGFDVSQKSILCQKRELRQL